VRRFAFRALVLVAAATACDGGAPPAPEVTGEAWAAADSLFHRDPSWLGADAAYSIDLGNDRSLWLFGDTFVATSDAHVRSEARMPRNTLALQSGRDPVTADIGFFWRTGPDGAPASFFPEQGERWHWPGHGARLGEGGPLVLFLSVLRPTPGQGLGFASAGWRAVVIDAPDADPAGWAPRAVEIPAAPFDAIVGGAVVREGGWVTALATRFEGTHTGYLARMREDDLMAGAAVPEWWAGARGWVGQAALDGLPEAVLDDAGAECSLHFDAGLGRWIHVASRGFGATTIAVRIAERIEGPYSAAVDAFTPPESSGPSPFVYAAKAHPELAGPDGGLVVTYATNSFDFGTLFKPEGAALYWPRFVRVGVALGKP
jgi:hypothetical protein